MSQTISFRKHIIRIALTGSLVILVSGLFVPALWGQFSGRLDGGHDHVVMPAASGKQAGYQDTAATAEITAYKNALGASLWVGMQATGTATFADDQSQVRATLSVLPANRAKLDLSLSKGHDISIVNGSHGWNQNASGKAVPMFSVEAAAGLLPLDLPLRATRPGETAYSIIDYGIVAVDGKSFHRIGIEDHIPAQRNFPERHDAVVLVDCYFDPATHLLEKTAALIPIRTNAKLRVLRVDSYSAYKMIGSLSLPTEISESINGQDLWSLTLSSLDLSNLPTGATFLPSK